jgi:hypothetical protein
VIATKKEIPMALTATTVASISNLMTLLLNDDTACAALASAASRRLESAARDSVLAVIPRAKPGVPHGTTDSDAVTAITTLLTDLDAND